MMGGPQQSQSPQQPQAQSKAQQPFEAKLQMGQQPAAPEVAVIIMPPGMGSGRGPGRGRGVGRTLLPGAAVKKATEGGRKDKTTQNGGK
jgi:hypothetical protein